MAEINSWDLNDVEKSTKFRDALHQTGVAVIRGVVQEKEALGWKELVKRYIASNPGTKGKLSDSTIMEPSTCWSYKSLIFIPDD